MHWQYWLRFHSVQHVGASAQHVGAHKCLTEKEACAPHKPLRENIEKN